MKNRFRNISYFLDLDYFEKIKITMNYDNYRNFDFFQNNPNLKSWICFKNDESNEASLKVRKLTVFKQRSFEVVEYAN